MNETAEPSVVAQRLQGLVVVALAGLLYVGPLAGLLALTVMTVAWPPAVGWRPLAAARVLLVYAPFAVVWLAVTLGYLHLMHAAGAPVSPQPQLVELAEHGADMPGFGLTVVAIVVLAPVFEEIVFRGYIFCALRTLLPAFVTHLLVALLFGLAHTLAYAFPIAVLALLFGWLRARYDALLPSIFAHAVHNGLTVVLAVGWPEFLDWMYPR